MFQLFLAKIKSRGFFQGIFVLFVLIFLDQFIKHWILKEKIAFVCNSGMAFSIKLHPVLFSFFWLVAIIYIFYLWQEKIQQSFFSQLPFLLIIAGGISNILDRFFYNCVIDYLPFLNLFTFNLADAFISVGAVMIVIDLEFRK